MRTRHRQPVILRVESYTIQGAEIVLSVQQWDTQPGRPDIPVGLPTKLRIPVWVWHDGDAVGAAVGALHHHLAVEAAERDRNELEGQERLPGL